MDLSMEQKMHSGQKKLFIFNQDGLLEIKIAKKLFVILAMPCWIYLIWQLLRLGDYRLF